MSYTPVEEIPGIVEGLRSAYNSGVTRCALFLLLWFPCSYTSISLGGSLLCTHVSCRQK